MDANEETSRIRNYLKRLDSWFYLILGLFFGTNSIAFGFISWPLSTCFLILSVITIALLFIASLNEQKINRLVLVSIFSLATYYVWSLHASLVYGHQPPELSSRLTLSEQYRVYSLGMIALGYIIFGAVELGVERVKGRVLQVASLVVVVLAFLGMYSCGSAAIAQSETSAFSSAIFLSLVFVTLSSITALMVALKRMSDSSELTG